METKQNGGKARLAARNYFTTICRQFAELKRSLKLALNLIVLNYTIANYNQDHSKLFGVYKK